MKIIINFYKQLFFQNRKWFEWIWIWFLISIGLGIIGFHFYPQLLDEIVNAFSDRFGDNPALDFNLALQIFKQNIIASSIALFGGIVLGIAPIFIVGVNGFLLGFVIMSLFVLLDHNVGESFGLIFGGIVPHGVIEIPAFLIAATLGSRLGLESFRRSSKGKRLQILKNNLIRSLVNLPGIAILLFIASLIEVFVSGKFVDKF